MVRRGEVHWLQLAGTVGSEAGPDSSGQVGRRPVLIIQNDVGNRSSPTTIVAAVTSQPRHRQYPFHVPFTAKESGLRLDGTVLCEQIQTVEQGRLGGLAGTLSPDKMQEVGLALHWSLGLEH